VRLPDFTSTPRADRTPALAVLGAALVLGLAAADAWLARELESRAEAAVAALGADLAAQRARTDRLSAAARRGAEAPALGALAVPAARILDHVASRLPGDVRLTDFDVAYRDAIRVRITAEARTPEAWDRFLAALAASPHLRELRPAGERRDDGMRVAVNLVWQEAER
jgi:hypothetical protein